MSVGHVARAIEAAGIPTVSLYVQAWESMARLVRPPRVLVTKFLQGRVVGPPGRPAVQRQVLLEAAKRLATGAAGDEWLVTFPMRWSEAVAGTAAD